MSKETVYEKRIEIPADCQVTVEDKTITVSGPKGTKKDQSTGWNGYRTRAEYVRGSTTWVHV